MSKKNWRAVGLTLLSASILLAPAAMTTMTAASTMVYAADTNLGDVSDDTSERLIDLWKYQKTDTNGITAGSGDDSDVQNYLSKAGDTQPMANVPFTVQRVSVVSGKKLDAGDAATYTVDTGFTTQTANTDANGHLQFDLGKGRASDGLYLVTEQDDPDVKTKSAPFIAQVPREYMSAGKDAHSLNYDVKVYPKNTVVPGPGLDKLVDADPNQGATDDDVKANDTKTPDDSATTDTAQAGGTAVWNILTEIPGALAFSQAVGNKVDPSTLTQADIAKAGNGDIAADRNDADQSKMKYEIDDTLDPNLTYKSVQFALGYYTTAGQLETISVTGKDPATNLVPTTDYTVTATPDPAKKTGDKLTVVFTPAGRVKLQDLLKANQKAITSTMFLVTDVTTTVNTGYTSGVINNSTTLTYGNHSGNTYTPTTNTPDHPHVPNKPNKPHEPGLPEIGVVQTDLEKVAQEDSHALKGAEFKIAVSQADAQAGKFIKRDSTGRLVYPDDTDYSASLPDYTATSGDDGTFNFVGLRATDKQDLDNSDAGNDVDAPENGQPTLKKADYNRQYYVMETLAPAGYDRMLNPIKVTASIAPQAADVTTVKDTNKPQLPLTGGAGLAVLIGVIVIAGGAGTVLYVTNRRKQH